MAKIKVFLLHGMGLNEEGWHVEIVNKLRELYQLYPRLNARGFDDRFDVIPIEYDSKFRELVERWAESAQSLGPIASGFDAQQVESLIGWLRNADDPTEAVWTHAADALLYRFFFLVRQQIKTHVVLQIAENLDASDKWAVVGHSLGTAVGHDGLDMLWTGRHEDGSPATGFEPRNDQVQLVMMFANVSRLLQTNPKVYQDTMVKPGRAGQAGRGCLCYVNVNHKLDPFTIPHPFDPDQWPEPDAEARGLYRNIELRHIHEPNVHSLVHYLSHPAVHIELFRSLTFRQAITNQQEKDALEAFPQFGDLSEEAAFSIKGRLEDISPALSDAWPVLATIWSDYQGLINDRG